ncbi:MAG: ABC transporter substrate-binding protein [Alphaproteobacteria bacterium]|nr:MAG: ABC transporter substrate-binding protein [Alphaproteobacteria bacterium]
MTKKLLNRLAAFPRLGLLAIAMAAGLASASHAQDAVRFGSVGGLTDAGVYLADELGYFKEVGITVTLTRMANAPTLITSIATNQLDVAGISITPGMFTAIEQGFQLRLVGDKNSSRPGFAATRLVVSSDLAGANVAETIGNLRGKSIAIPSKAGSAYYNTAQLLKAQGVELSEVTIAELSYSNMVAALATGAVQAAYMIEPFVSQVIRAGDGVDASNVGDVTKSDKAQINVPIVYSETFAKNRNLAQRFMTAYMRGVRVYNDAFAKDIDKDKVIEIMARRAEVDPEVVRTSFPAGLDPNQEINVQDIDDMQAFFVEHGFLKAIVPLDELVDTSFAEAAVAELGRYE